MKPGRERTDRVSFREPLLPVTAEPGAVHFSGIGFYRIDDETMHAYVVMRSGDAAREEKLRYWRRAPR